jgi:nucleoside-diphosphate-sugar epimerase
MLRILVTGASGFIGRHLLRALGEKQEIFGLERNVPAENDHFAVNWIEQDLGERLEHFSLPERCDVVIHLAQSEHYRDFPNHAVDVFSVNTVSTLRLLDWARQIGVKTFILASSGGIYGGGEEEFSEEQEALPRGDLGFYLGTKLCSEVLAENYTQYMNVITLRFFFVYGPSQRRSMLIPRLVESIREKQPIMLHGKDGIRINPTYVSDAVEAICGALQLKQSHKINVGGPQVLSLREIGHIIGEALKKKPYFKIDRGVEPPHLIGDISKMSKLLIKPKVSIKEGIARYLENENT